MASFNDLGLREPLVMALEEEGIDQPTALQEAAIPVLRREGNLVARAASGSGKTLAYGLGILDRIEPRGGGEDGDEEAGGGDEGGARVLVLVPTAEQAEHAALALVPYAHAAELTVAVSGPGWGTRAGDADVLVATPGQVMDAVRASGVKLHALEAVVIDGASEIEALGGWEAVESVFDNIPREAQRVVLTPELSPAVQDLVDRRVKRAIRYPAQAALADQAEVVEVTGVVGYIAVSEREKLDVLARLLGGERDGDAPPLLVCRTDERAAQVAEAISMRGFLVGDAGDEEADVLILGASEAAETLEGGYGGTVISFDVPPDDRALKLRHGGEVTGFVLARPRELAHLRETAARAGLEARPAGVLGEASPKADELRAFREQLRRAIRDEDLGAQMLVLEPLFDEFTAAEVAAAAAALLRRRPAAAETASEIGASGARTSTASSAPAARTVRATRPTTPAPSGGGAAFSRLFVSVGERDGLKPGDLVGAIAGEADLPGSAVGKIEIRDTFSVVEVPADQADRIIEAVNGITIRGRSVRVDFDRGGDRARRPGPPRRQERGGDREGGDDRPRRTFRQDRGGEGGDDRPRRTFRPGPGGEDRPRRTFRDDRGGGDDRPRRPRAGGDDRPPRRSGPREGGPPRKPPRPRE